jgi:hypothetical protein
MVFIAEHTDLPPSERLPSSVKVLRLRSTVKVLKASAAGSDFDSGSATDIKRSNRCFRSSVLTGLFKSQWVWHMSNMKSKKEVAEASAFLYGYGELFKYSQGGVASCSNRLIPNYLFFVIEMAHTVLKAIVLVTFTDAGTQSALIVCIECIFFLLFVIQRPFADPALNLDATICRAASLSSFVALSAYGRDSGVVSDERYQQVMLTNLAALYWVVGFQVLRQVLLLYQTLPATFAPQPPPRLEQARTMGRLDLSHPAASQPENLIRQADVLAVGDQPPSISFTGPSGQGTPIETRASADVTQARINRARRARRAHGATTGSTTMGSTAELNSIQVQQLEWLEDLCDEGVDDDEYAGEFGV